jgi:hypothetical protein
VYLGCAAGGGAATNTSSGYGSPARDTGYQQQQSPASGGYKPAAASGADRSVAWSLEPWFDTRWVGGWAAEGSTQAAATSVRSNCAGMFHSIMAMHILSMMRRKVAPWTCIYVCIRSLLGHTHPCCL